MIEQWKELKETIIEMRDNNGTGTQQEVCKFLANYMNTLEKQMISSGNSNRWIPVSERPPEDEQKCLISIDDMVDIARYSTNLYEVDEYDFYGKNGVSGFYYYDDEEYGYLQVCNVEAWMPLPEPYKGGENHDKGRSG